MALKRYSDLLKKYCEDNKMDKSLLATFDASAFGGSKNFRLTRYVRAKKDGYKVNNEVIYNLLYGKGKDLAGSIGISPNVFVMQINKPNFSVHVASSTDYIYAFINNPYALGRIACATIINGMLGMGLTVCHSISLTFSFPMAASKRNWYIVMALMKKGFRDCGLAVGAHISSMSLFYNPWFLVGGTAVGFYSPDSFLQTDGAEAGDVIILTKPLGTHVALCAMMWLEDEQYRRLMRKVLTRDEVKKMYTKAIKYMVRLNTYAVNEAREYNTHAMIDVGGQGLLYHADLLAKKQKNHVSFVIHNLPLIGKTAKFNKAFHNMFRLCEGHCPETSGGVLIIMKQEEVATYIKGLQKAGHTAWAIGVVQPGDRIARLIQRPRLLEI